jgi:hypothetical protein
VVDTLRELDCEVTVVAEEAASDLVKLAEVVGARVLVEADDGPPRARKSDSLPRGISSVVSPGVAPERSRYRAPRGRRVLIFGQILSLRGGSGTNLAEPAEWIMVHQDEETDVAVDLALRIFQAASVPSPGGGVWRATRAGCAPGAEAL